MLIRLVFLVNKYNVSNSRGIVCVRKIQQLTTSFPLIKIFTDHFPCIIRTRVQPFLYIFKPINLCVERHTLYQQMNVELLIWFLFYPAPCLPSALTHMQHLCTSPLPSSHALQCAFGPEIATAASFLLPLPHTPQNCPQSNQRQPPNWTLSFGNKQFGTYKCMYHVQSLWLTMGACYVILNMYMNPSWKHTAKISGTINAIFQGKFIILIFHDYIVQRK
jgi:hypothetical protein